MIRLFRMMAELSRVSYTSGKDNKTWPSIALSALFMLMCGISQAAESDPIKVGKSIVMEKSKGNCLACHAIEDGKQAGNLGPPLIGMKARFPDIEDLRSQIWDATARNPDSRMPPFGHHGILSREEIDRVVEYLYTL